MRTTRRENSANGPGMVQGRTQVGVLLGCPTEIDQRQRSPDPVGLLMEDVADPLPDRHQIRLSSDEAIWPQFRNLKKIGWRRITTQHMLDEGLMGDECDHHAPDRPVPSALTHVLGRSELPQRAENPFVRGQDVMIT